VLASGNTTSLYCRPLALIHLNPQLIWHNFWFNQH
jgi:hypothetical protein